MAELLLAVFIIIQVLDVWTTKRGFDLGGTEALLLPRFMFDRLGFWPTVLIIKGLAIALAWWVTVNVENAWIFTGILCLAGIYVLWNNFRFIRRAT
jgi:hypothetical protein